MRCEAHSERVQMEIEEEAHGEWAANYKLATFCY